MDDSLNSMHSAAEEDGTYKSESSRSHEDHELSPAANRHGLLITALAPAIPQVIGSAFNIWYNFVVIHPLLVTTALRHRFVWTTIIYNALVYTVAVAIWLRIMASISAVLRALDFDAAIASEELYRARRRIVHLPWIAAIISGAAWLGCIPVFLAALASADGPVSAQLLWHLPVSFLVSAFIAVTQTFFLVEIASHACLFLPFFRDVRPDRLAGVYPPSVRTRGLMWAISAGVCPIASLLLLMFAPHADGPSARGFAFFVAAIGTAFGLGSAVMITRLVARPVDELRAAFQAVGQGQLDVRLPLRRADEFGSLVGDFNQMVADLSEKERLRRIFGLHVGEKVAQQILARDPALGGTEQIITAMFVDIRGFTSRSATADASSVVKLLNRFLHAMLEVVEHEHHGIVNQFLGDGFMAIFGAGEPLLDHAGDALAAGRAMLLRLERLNTELMRDSEPALEIGIGINSGPAIVGSIGSPERMEFTAIGNTVNVASRIESLNKAVGTSLLLSKTTRDALTDSANLRALPPQAVKGVAEPMEIFTLDRSSAGQE